MRNNHRISSFLALQGTALDCAQVVTVQMFTPHLCGYQYQFEMSYYLSVHLDPCLHWHSPLSPSASHEQALTDREGPPLISIYISSVAMTLLRLCVRYDFHSAHPR